MPLWKTGQADSATFTPVRPATTCIPPGRSRPEVHVNGTHHAVQVLTGLPDFCVCAVSPREHARTTAEVRQGSAPGSPRSPPPSPRPPADHPPGDWLSSAGTTLATPPRGRADGGLCLLPAGSEAGAWLWPFASPSASPSTCRKPPASLLAALLLDASVDAHAHAQASVRAQTWLAPGSAPQGVRLAGSRETRKFRFARNRHPFLSTYLFCCIQTEFLTGGPLLERVVLRFNPCRHSLLLIVAFWPFYA